MCACDTGYSGDGLNCTGIQLIPFLIRENDTVYLVIKNEEKSMLSPDNSSILVKEEKNIYAFLSVYLRHR